MIAWYEDGLTCQEIAEQLGKIPFWVQHWKKHLGREYHPTDKMVQKVLKRSGCKMRLTGATINRNGNWKGDRSVDRQGYVLVVCRDHPHVTKKGYVREHRLIVEKALGRYLKPTEVVHHIDDDPSNNDIDNLLVFETQAQHVSVTMKEKVPPQRTEKAQAARWKGHQRKAKPRKK
jgi:hypothetical protein